AARAGLPSPRAAGGAPPSFEWPLRARASATRPGHHATSNFVDHDPASPGALLDWNCGTRTYDLADGYDHAGTDFVLWPFPWATMFEESVAVVAAAPGTILEKDDGHDDRSCELGAAPWNAVYVLHDDGGVAWYGHLKKGSATPLAPGERVEAGEFLGLVGSSGSSTAPHLHFEVHDAEGAIVDPFEGPCNAVASRWLRQPPYFDSALNRLATHAAPPEFEACGEPEAVHARDRFRPGEVAVFAVYLRDELAGQTLEVAVRRPDGELLGDGRHVASAAHYAWSYWYWSFELPADAPPGEWSFEARFGEQIERVAFTVPEPDAGAAAAASLLALAAAAQAGSKKGFHGRARAASTSSSDGVRSRPAASAARVAARLLR
ncbi:MAG: hypothetical protein DCC71_21375, partial [Proteobacteria bacterium]